MPGTTVVQKPNQSLIGLIFTIFFAIIKIGDLSNLFEGKSAAFFKPYQLIQPDKHAGFLYVKKFYLLTEKEKMLSGKLYLAQNVELVKDNTKAKKLIRLFNKTTEEEMKYIITLLKELFEKTGENLYIEPPFRCDYGCHISSGDNYYANFDCIILEVCKVTIGNQVFFGPSVSIFTAAYPIDADVRNTLLEFGKPVNIGNSAWIGGNTIINPGITIGNKRKG
jgi:maltose O-acetyltransferase